MIVLLVSVGVFQEYITDNITQLLKLDFKVHVITEKSNFDKLDNKVTKVDSDSLDVEYFDNKSRLDRSHRNGFWHNASKRLFLVYEYMKSIDLRNVIHLENDVLVYSNLDYKFDNKMYLTMDAENRCIPGIVYIPSYEFIEKLVKNYNFSQNDMQNMSSFYHRNKDIVKTFPIIDHRFPAGMYNENFNEFNSIFDAAAMGQYLGGVDPRNIPGDTTGFVNETCVVKYDKYKFNWVRGVPFLGDVPINNLHIHCKNLKKFI